jgi:Tfp pilus assembly protein PilE
MHLDESGRSIVEILGVMAIMGVITVLGISGYQAAVEKNRRDSLDIKLYDLSNQISEAYSGRSFAQYNTYAYFTDELVGQGFDMKDPWGGEIRARYPLVGVDYSNQYVLTLKLNRTTCEYVLSRYKEMVEKGEICATLYPDLSHVEACDNRGCVGDENLVTFRYRLM